MYKQALFLFAPLLFVANSAFANQYSSSFLNIDVGAESYSAAVLNFDSGGVTWKTGAPYEILSDGVKFSPGEQIGGGGDEERGGMKALMFNVSNLHFSAKSGYQITGYEFSFSGQVRLSHPAWAEIRGSVTEGGETNILPFTGDHNWSPYTFLASAAADSPAGGEVRADGWLFFDAPKIYDFYVDNEGYIVEYIAGSSRADITLDSLTVRAIVAAIPEPQTYLMFLAGLAVLARRTRNNHRWQTMAPSRRMMS